MRQRIKRGIKWIKKEIKSVHWLALFLVVVAILAGEWAGGSLQALIARLFSLSEWLELLISIFILLACLIVLYRIRYAFMPFRTLSSHPCEPHKGLIILLSTSNIPVAISKDSFPLVIKNWKKEEAELKGDSLEKDIESLDAFDKKARWNWQQLLRGLTPHKEDLQTVYLIGSKDGQIPGSWHDLDNVENLIKRYFSEAEIKKLDSPVDFEDFDEIMTAVIKAISWTKEKGISDKDIVVDITGGQKTASIAGAVVTMNKKVTFQYVQTSFPCQVLAYDVRALSGDSFEG
ncbi:hypothetical protein KJ693_06480 [bacterium]|nr:hypothetical protein [bacterium]MBU1614946.1 hypothetical protein [bacterium]